MKALIALLLLCSVAYAAPKQPARPGRESAPAHATTPQPVPEHNDRAFAYLLQPPQTYSRPAPLTEAEYRAQKKRFAEWQVYKRSANRAGNRQSGISVHDEYINAAQNAVRQVQGR